MKKKVAGTFSVHIVLGVLENFGEERGFDPKIL